jgi:hypothetical protein
MLTSSLKFVDSFFQGYHFYLRIIPIVFPTDDQIALFRIMFVQLEIRRLELKLGVAAVPGSFAVLSPQ